MTAILVLALTVFSLSVGAIVSSWNRYGQVALAARSEWLACPQTREVRITIVEYGAKPAGQVIALPIRKKAAPAPYRQPLRAAA